MSDTNDKIKAFKVVTPRFRLAFPQIWTPKAYQMAGQAPKAPEFSITMLFDKKTDIKAMQLAAKAAVEDKWGAWEKRPKENFKWPFRDGDNKEDIAGFSGHIFVRASAKAEKPPQILSPRKVVLSRDDGSVYSGCYCHAVVIACAFDHAGMNRGVKFNLQAIMKVADGERLGGQRDAINDFAGIAVEDSSDDPASFDGFDNADEFVI